MVVRDNLAYVTSLIGKNNFTPSKKSQIGRVYGVVTTENTPTPEMFDKVGGYNGIGTIFYLNYDPGRKITGSIDNDFLNTCLKAKPLSPQDQYYPVTGELVLIEEGPSPLFQANKNTQQKYYSLINLWNNPQQNAQPANSDASLGITFYENPDVRPLIPYEGDNILGGRQGSSLRFSSTTLGVTPANEWSEIGGEYDPITVLTNGLDYDPNKSYYVEQINKDKSSIYLTSTQKIPLITDKTGVLNNLTNPINVPDYGISSQIILNSDRVVLNSKKDEVMIFAKTNVEINTKNVINLNADDRVHLNANTVFLGPYNSTNTPQPVLLGWETYKVFDHLVKTLSKLSSQLSSAVSTQEGSAIISLQIAGKELSNNMKTLNKLLKNIPSKKVFTS
jgi:hypothetical protein